MLMSGSNATQSMMECIQNRDSPSFGAPLMSTEIKDIQADQERLTHYIGATPFLIACDMRKKSVCQAMLHHMPASELHFDQIWQFTTSLMMVCENKWKDIAETMLYENESTVLNLFYVSSRERIGALEYALRIPGNHALLCSFFMHMVSPENPQAIYDRAIQLVTNQSIELDKIIPKSLYVSGESTLFTQVVRSHDGDNIETVLSDLLAISTRHLDHIQSNADAVWTMLVKKTSPAFIRSFIELPYMQNRLKTDARVFSHLFGNMVEDGLVDESMYMIQFATRHQIPHFVLDTVLMDDPSTSILEVAAEVADASDEMRPVLDAIRQLDSDRARPRLAKSNRYITVMLDGVDKSRRRGFAHGVDRRHPRLPPDIEGHIATFAAWDDKRYDDAPLGFNGGRHTRSRHTRSRHTRSRHTRSRPTRSRKRNRA
jgi:hypothetical protein